MIVLFRAITQGLISQTVQQIDAINKPTLGREALSGISYFSVEGSDVRLVFDYEDNKEFFDSLETEDNQFYNVGFAFELYDKQYEYYIPVIDGVNINYKTGLITIKGVDAVSRAIKLSQENDVTIHRQSRDALLQHYTQNRFPDPLEAVDEVVRDKTSYSPKALTKHLLTKLEVPALIDFADNELPEIPGGYKVLNPTIPMRDIKINVFNKEKRSNAEWYFDPCLVKTEAYYFKHEARKVVWFMFQYYYNALSKESFSSGRARYEFHEYVYRVQFATYEDSPFFVNANHDGNLVLDGREPEDLQLGDSEDNYIDEGSYLMEYGNRTEDYVVTLKRKRATDNIHFARKLYVSSDQWLVNLKFRLWFFYINDMKFIRNREDPLVKELPTSFPTVFDPPLEIPYIFRNNELIYISPVKMNVYQPDHIPLDDKITFQKVKPAAELLKELLFMGNLAMIREGGKAMIVNKDKEGDAIEIDRSNILEMSRSRQRFTISGLPSYSNTIHKDQIVSYLKQYYEARLKQFGIVLEVRIIPSEMIQLRDIVKIDDEEWYVAGLRTEENSNIQTLTLWQKAI